MKQYLLFLCFLSCFVFISLKSSAKAQGPASSHQKTTQAYQDDLAHFGDVIDVDVVGGFEFDWRGTLTAEGFLNGLDGFSEPIYGLCRSEAQIAADVTRVFSEILRDPKVVVKIIDKSNRAVVRLDGAVRTATRFRLKRNVQLRELLVLAGGLTDGASGEVSILRRKDLSCASSITPVSHTDGKKSLLPQDNGLLTINIKLSELLSGKKDADPQIVSGDIITVTRALPIYVIGAVNNPGPIYSRDQMTVSRVVATAGGTAKDADGDKVSIYRREGLEVRSIEADLGKIKRGETIDEVLRPFDIIEVAGKGKAKRRFPPVIANESRNRTGPDLPLRIVD